MTDPRLFNDARDEIVARARATNVECEFPERRDGTQDLLLKIPNGKRKKDLLISRLKAEQLATVNFNSWVALGDYNALWDKSSKMVEVEIRGQSTSVFITMRQLTRVPGVQKVAPDINQPTIFDSLDDSDDVDTWTSTEKPEGWRLSLGGSKVDIEISPSTVNILLFKPHLEFSSRTLGRIPSIKLFGVEFTTHDEALRATEKIVNSILFDLDLCTGLAFSMTKQRPRRGFREDRDPVQPVHPSRVYAEEALSLYAFGRSANGMPIQQFLAFYQTLEYFFSTYWEKGQAEYLRSQLSDPRFRTDDNDKLTRIIRRIKGDGNRGVGEREQLERVIEGCISDEDLREFISSDSNREVVLGDRKLLLGVDPVALQDKNRTVISQAAKRIYQIRCRIVHGKQDGGGDNAPPLLPSSDEEGLLWHDIDLVQLLAQKALIASSSGDAWWLPRGS
ncbi:hypothetical protein [Amycolatopsis sp. WAC 01375]|uniref:hypothetical protein n=1 Tax=Amycolatopsis sp. WAC 01375 TaxID=2203194 RepID=UPI000F7A625C|nr:hypothetical protein [Amycolatopsis sp. WAC 01375]